MFRHYKAVALACFAAVVLVVVSLILQLDLPRPSGPDPVGRTVIRWIDSSRQEVSTGDPDDLRQVVAVIWYPAQPGTGSPGAYIQNLDRVSKALSASGEVSTLGLAGLPFIRSNSYQDAQISLAQPAYPVLLFSPGNATNMEFYTALAEDLASHGYIVVGLNHPYDVAAVELADGGVAQFASERWPMEMSANMAMVQERVEVRTEDAIFVLDQLEALNAGTDGLLVGRLDLLRVGVMGHSLGGITAAQACQREQRFKACLNLDGLQQGGAFSTEQDPPLPVQPFMLITKEEQLHPSFVAQFEALTSPSYRVVVHGARHDQFTDGPLLTPSLLPLPGDADKINAITRAHNLAFFDQVLKEQQSPLLSSPHSDHHVSVEVY